MAFIDLFSGIAAAYAAARPTYPDALFKRLAALAPATMRAWDCGTGSGQAAIGIARWFARVDATDASAQQIAHAVPHERVHYSVRTAEASGLPNRSCDLVSVAQALHWFDRPRFFEETRRVLKPGGIIAVIGSSWFYIAPSIDPVVDEFLLQPIDGYWTANNQLLWDGYRSIEFPFPRDHRASTRDSSGMESRSAARLLPDVVGGASAPQSAWRWVPASGTDTARGGLGRAHAVAIGGAAARRPCRAM